ncbi:MAG: Hpt domain-containing protein [Pseudomonadota bacterium]
MNFDQTATFNSGLHWVRSEFDQSLTRARTLIEYHIENPEDLLPLQQALVELHTVRGTASMIQCFGVATVAEEMKTVLHEIMQGRIQELEPAYSALLSATVQVSDYIDALSSGMDDCVIVLQPILSELRLSRGKTLVTELELFSAQLNAFDHGKALLPGAAIVGDAAGEARKLLPVFQASMLNWLKNNVDVNASLGRIGKIAEQIAAQSTNASIHQLWRTVAAVVEALLTRTLEDSMDLKRAMGATATQIRALIDEGESAAAAKLGDLNYQLLFFVARSSGQGPRVSTLRVLFRLNSYLPTNDQIEQRRIRIRGPGIGLLSRVADEIRRDFTHVKDSIDLSVRSGGKAGIGLEETRNRLQRIANTLATLGLPALQRVVGNQVKLLESLEADASSSNLWMDIATSILQVEHSLEDALFSQIVRSKKGAGGISEVDKGIPHSRDLAEGTAALLRESLVNLARIKSSVDAYIRENESEPPSDAQRLLKEIIAGFDVLQNTRAAELISALERYVSSPSFAQLRDTQGHAERFADAIAAIEFYIEAIRDHVPNVEPMLESMAHYVGQLNATEAAPAIPELEELELVLEQPELVAPVAAVAVSKPAPVVVAAEDVDPEIRDIFLEEASEVLSTLDSALPRLRRDAQDMDTLTTVRRAFHTLKGSGRMVGAQQIGEFGWAVESLLNRCLDGSVPAGAVVVDAIVDAVAMLPGLIESFRNNAAPDPALQALIERASNLAEGRGAQEAEELDMTAIFREDAREKLEAVTHWLEQQNRSFEWFAVEDEVVRSFHTLRGAAHIVHSPSISELSGALETYLDSARGAGLELPRAALVLIEDAEQTLRRWVDAIGTPAASSQDLAPWLERIQALQAEVPEQARQATADRQLAEIFSSEAFDLVQKIEETAKAWAHAPENLQGAAEIKALSHTLLGAALMSQCSSIAIAGRALNVRMAVVATHAIKPESGFFTAFDNIAEGFYQLIDAYREGKALNDGSDLVAQIEALPLSGHADLAVPTSASQEEIIEMPPVVETESITVDGLSAEQELAAIFIGEARELLENLDAYASAWEKNPAGAESGAAVKSVLHTLKGSARVAGSNGLGEVAQYMEALVATALSEGRADAALFSRLHQASDGLHRVLAEMERGGIPNVSALMSDIESAAPAQSSSVELLEIIEEAAPQLEVIAAPVRQEYTPSTVAAPVVQSADDELAEIFSAEASELLETLQQNFNAWQRDPREFAPAREMQRALHTLKGGARMAGLDAMGDVSHEMETRINNLEVRGASDGNDLKPVAADLETLHHMHDLLSRGDTASLRGAGAVPTGPKVESYDETSVIAGAVPEVIEPVLSAPVAPLLDGAWDPMLFWKPESEQTGLAALRRETARVPVESLDNMLNEAGEISIYRSRLEEQHSALQAQLNEMSQAVTRVREQLRMMDMETEAQISARGRGPQATLSQDRYAGDFDPLEMDRYTRMQELSRSLSESVGDLSSLHTTMDGLVGEAETLLLQQARINTDVQQGLMRTLMVPFSRQVARLQRVVKQAAHDNGKMAEAQFVGIESELDRNVLERMTAPLEHLMRNAVVHGIEDPQTRVAAGKGATGTVSVTLRREGTQLLVELRDDGKGLDFDAIRATAIKRGLIPADAQVADEDIAQFIFEAGFSTAKNLTQDAGRGIGMDVVAAEVKQLGGTLEIGSETGKGARFLIRLPLNLAISQALLVSVSNEMYAIPLPSIEGIARIPREQLDALYDENGPTYGYGGHEYRVRYLGDFIGASRGAPKEGKTVSAILVRLGEGLGTQDRRIAVVVDSLFGNREVVSKAVGPMISAVVGVSSATILADGRVVLILDVPALTQDRTRRALITLAAGKANAVNTEVDARELVMVVDDSITIRRVTERLLLKNGYRVSTAKDGLDAMAKLQTESPVTVLLDIEMPRADGFEVATFIRNNERLRNLPIIMITSRSGDKHRERAMQIGVNRYLIKPYQEDQLISEVRGVLEETRGS